MSFHEVRFPEDISYGSTGGPGYRTVIIETTSGAEQRVSRWQDARNVYRVRYAKKTQQQMMALLSFYRARRGALHGFRFKDHRDYSTAADGVGTPSSNDQSLGTGDGSTLTFQLRKGYTSGGITVWRNLTKIVANTIKVRVGGTELSTGWSVNLNTGIITFSVAPADTVVVKAGCEFDVPVRFSKDVDTLLEMAFESYDDNSTDGLELVEIKNTTPYPADVVTGGSEETCLLGSYTLGANAARVQVLQPSTSGISVFLPDMAKIPPGGPVFWIVNTSPDYSLTLKDADGGTVATLSPGRAVEVLLTISSTGSRVWYIL